MHSKPDVTAMASKTAVSALSDWDRAGNEQPLAKLTVGQVNVLTDIEVYMEGRRNIKEVRKILFIRGGRSMSITIVSTAQVITLKIHLFISCTDAISFKRVL